VRDLDLFLADSAGNEVDRDYAQDASPVVRVCPTATGAFTVRMHMASGQAPSVSVSSAGTAARRELA